MVYVNHDVPETLPDPAEMLRGFFHYVLVALVLALLLRRRAPLAEQVKKAAVGWLGGGDRCGRLGCGLVGLSARLETVERRLPRARVRDRRLDLGEVPAGQRRSTSSGAAEA